ncbi:hypothetical protein MESS4_560070 [Mesorhizobium sp. STM 4661]|nr:hypothetical protein MESS4_560070 [Mesorhizobium sp. STM 4661]
MVAEERLFLSFSVVWNDFLTKESRVVQETARDFPVWRYRFYAPKTRRV